MKPQSTPPKPAKHLQALPKNAPGEVRIIGGQWKRSKLSVLSKPGLRPTPDRVRETLFNWLGQDLNGLKCVDAFAGSGALGFEAASRGASEVLLVEQDPRLVAALQANASRLKATTIRVQRGDGISLLRSLPKSSIDVIFLDPPFDSSLYNEVIAAAAGVLSAQGAIYLEAPEAWSDESLAELGLRIVKQGKASAVHFHLLKLIE